MNECRCRMWLDVYGVWRMESDARTRIHAARLSCAPISYLNLCCRYCVSTNRRLMLIKNVIIFSGRREMKSVASNCIFHLWLLVEWMKYERLLRAACICFYAMKLWKCLNGKCSEFNIFISYFLLSPLCDNYVIILQRLSIAIILCGCSILFRTVDRRTSARW